ncbi:MAG TPA: hypothetical protein VG929_03705 [Actinomycetota bacterium]|nr:hypothetical protein [Actinomycetota bacterium]
MGVLLLAQLPSAVAAIAGRNGRIVVRTGSSEKTVYRSMRPDGSGARRFGVVGINARWSSDATWVLYQETGGGPIWKARPDGTEAVQVSDPPASDGQPTWSPDDEKIVFTRTISYQATRPYAISLFMMRVDGTDLTQLTRDESFDFQPAWSPDARRIAFVRCASYNWLLSDCHDAGDLMVVNVDGSDLERLTVTERSESDPDWAPDSARVAFTCDGAPHASGTRNPYTKEAPNGGICVLNLRTSRVRMIYARHNRGYDPAWSPNGRWITFVVYPRNEENTDAEIYKIRPDGTGLRRLTNNLRDDLEPQWLAR